MKTLEKFFDNLIDTLFSLGLPLMLCLVLDVPNLVKGEKVIIVFLFLILVYVQNISKDVGRTRETVNELQIIVKTMRDKEL